MLAALVLALPVALASMREALARGISTMALASMFNGWLELQGRLTHHDTKVHGERQVTRRPVWTWRRAGRATRRQIRYPAAARDSWGVTSVPTRRDVVGCHGGDAIPCRAPAAASCNTYHITQATREILRGGAHQLGRFVCELKIRSAPLTPSLAPRAELLSCTHTPQSASQSQPFCVY